MKTALLALSAAALLSGCSIHTKQQLTAVRASGVPESTVRHLAENTPLTPSDLIDMKRRNVSDDVPIFHLERIGVDYEARKEDIARLRAAKVSDRVVDALHRASDRYTYWRYNAPQPIYVDPYPWYGPTFRYTYVHHRRCR